jgi:hypothetical protein
MRYDADYWISVQSLGIEAQSVVMRAAVASDPARTVVLQGRVVRSA